MKRLILPIVLLTAVLNVYPTEGQSQYVFKPGSRQAVKVEPQQFSGQPQGTYQRSGGMTIQPRQYPTLQTSTQQNSSRQAPTNWRQARQNSTTAPTGKDRGHDYVDHVQIGGGTRPFRVHLPTNHNKSRATPVVLIFAGLKMSGESMIAVTGLSGTANRNNFIAVYCESSGGEWEDGMKNQRHDDVGYVDAVITRLAQTTAIDTHRVYAVGLSNGGYFAQLLACSLPDKIAATAVVASTGMEQALNRSPAVKAMPIVFFLGTDDPLINWGDGKPKSVGKYASKLGQTEIDPALLSLVRYGGWFAVPDLINFWTTHNRCQGAPRTIYEPDRDPKDGMRVKKEIWGTRGNEVVLYTIEGGAHTWPGCILLAGKRQAQCCQDINTGEEIWDFFKTQSR